MPPDTADPTSIAQDPIETSIHPSLARTLESIVDEFIANDAKTSSWDTFRSSLLECQRAHARDCVSPSTSFSRAPALELLGGPIRHAYDGMLHGALDRELVAAFPLARTRRRLTAGDCLDDDASASDELRARIDAPFDDVNGCEHSRDSARAEEDISDRGALGYASEELRALGAVGQRRTFAERHPAPSACLKHICALGRVWQGTILIPGSGNAHETASPYAFQVLWYDSVAGMFLISHTAQGDEQLCHLVLHDDGSSGTMRVSFSDNETYCTGTIDGESGVISGTVGQLVRAEEGFFEEADATRNRFTLAPVFAEPLEDDKRPYVDGLQNRVLRRQYLLAQWSRSADVLSCIYSSIQFIKDSMRSEHMWKYMLLKLTRETSLLNLRVLNVQKPFRFGPLEFSWDGDSEDVMTSEAQMLWPRFPEFAYHERLLMPGVSLHEEREFDWCDIWTIERLNAELLCCKFRYYVRLMRARVFLTSAEKRSFLLAFRNIRKECHGGMNRVHTHFNLLLWRLFYGSDYLDVERHILLIPMEKILRVQANRMVIAYEGVDKALRECELRLPIDAVKRRCSMTTGHEQYTCSICLLELECGVEALKLDCLHTFHLACCSTWLHSHATCPNCRVGVSESY